MTPVRLLTVVRTWFWFLVAGTILGVALSFAFSAITPPSYAGQVTVLVTPVPTASGIDFSDIEATQALAPTFAELATTTPVLQRVIRSTGVNITPDRLALEISTRVPAGTSLIMISVTHPDAAAAAALANGIAAELEAYPTTGIIGQPNALQVAIVVVDPASPPLTPTGPGLAVRLALGGGIALFVCLALAVFVENLRQMRRTARDGRGSSPQWPTEPAEQRGLTTVHGGARGTGRGWEAPDDLAPARVAAQPVATSMARPAGTNAGAYIPPRQAPPLPIPLTPHDRAAPAGPPEAMGDRFGSRPAGSPVATPAPSPTSTPPARLQPSTTGLIATPDSPRPPAPAPVASPAPWSARSNAPSPAPTAAAPTSSWPNGAQPHRGLPTIVPVVRVSERPAVVTTPRGADGAEEPAAADMPAGSTPTPANRKGDGDGAMPTLTPPSNPAPVPTSTPAAKTASAASGPAADRRGAKGDQADRNGATAGPKGGKSAAGRKARSGSRNQPAVGDEPTV